MNKVMDKWTKHLPIVRDEQIDGPIWRHALSGRLVIPPIDKIRKEVMRVWHDHKGGGHLGQDETMRKIQYEYLWPKAQPWIKQYVKGCATCQ